VLFPLPFPCLIPTLFAHFPANDRRNYILGELQQDLEYIVDHMEENPRKRKHKEKMLRNHRDFFLLLKWNKEQLQPFSE
jgi:hypothetical protein